MMASIQSTSALHSMMPKGTAAPAAQPAAAPARIRDNASSVEISAGSMTPMGMAQGTMASSGTQQASMATSITSISGAQETLANFRSDFSAQGPGNVAQSMMQDFVGQMSPETQGSNIENMTMVQNSTEINIGGSGQNINSTEGSGQTPAQQNAMGDAGTAALKDMNNSIKGLDATTTEGFGVVMEKLEEMSKQLEVMMKAMKEMMEAMKQMMEAQAEKVSEIGKESGIPVFRGMTEDVAEAIARAMESRSDALTSQTVQPVSESQDSNAAQNNQTGNQTGGQSGGQAGGESLGNGEGGNASGGTASGSGSSGGSAV